MKATIMAGALAALVYGTTAGAQSQTEPQSPPEGEEVQGSGGSGASDMQPSQEPDFGITDDFGYEEEGVGGSGVGEPSRDFGEPSEDFSTPSEDFGAPPQELEPEAFQEPRVTEEGVGGAGFEPRSSAKRADMRGVTVLFGGGIEGYTGELAPGVNPGGTAGVSATFRPSRVIGLELGYSGALNEVDERFVGTEKNGTDIVRNGAHAALTMGLTATPLQPYVLGGVGVHYYNVRNGEAAGFQDDTVGAVPVGLGLRSHMGRFTADARLNYNFLLGQQFAPSNNETSGSYTGTINLGGTF